MVRVVDEPPRLLPFPILAVPFSLIVFGITFKSHNARYAVFAATATFLFSTIRYTTTGIPAWDYPVGNALAILIFLASDFLVLTDSFADLRLTNQFESAPFLSFRDRLKWATRLVFSPRMIGWTCEPRNILPPKFPYSINTQTFILKQCTLIALEMVAINAVDLFMSFTSAFSAGGARLVTYHWAWRSVYILEMGAAMAVGLDLSHRLWMVALSLTGKWQPSDFRPLFGSLCEACTLRGFWGRTWHQLLRRKLISHTRYLSERVLRLPRNSPYTSLFGLYTIFLISGIIHTLGDYMCLQHSGSGSIYFFPLQALAIHGESTVLGLARKSGFRIFCDSHWMVVWVWRGVGVLWVWQWFTWCLPMMVDPILDRGLVDDLPKVKVIQAIITEPWFIQSRPWVLENLTTFNRESYVQALLNHHDYLPEDPDVDVAEELIEPLPALPIWHDPGQNATWILLGKDKYRDQVLININFEEVAASDDPDHFVDRLPSWIYYLKLIAVDLEIVHKRPSGNNKFMYPDSYRKSYLPWVEQKPYLRPVTRPY